MPLDPDTPNYTLAEASMYLRMSVQTLGRWGRGWGQTTPVLKTGPMLSFVNLVEYHMLSVFRHLHEVPLQRIRKAVTELARQRPDDPHPLATERFWTDGRDILLERVKGGIVSLNEPGQAAFGEAIRCYCERVEWKGGMPTRMFPWTVNLLSIHSGASERRSVVIDPHVAFGRSVVAGTRVTTKAIKDQWDVGALVKEIAEDFDVTEEQVQDAVRLEEARPPSHRKAG